MKIENIIAGCDLDQAAYLHKRIETALAKAGSLNIVTTSGAEIKNIKSIASWGQGFYYGKRKNQKSFTQSISVFSIQSVNNVPVTEL